ncbi:hypothetical protein BH11BAC3_BH11BAC3_02600 [soil metagenome]
MKFWRSYEKGDDKIIAYDNGTIYRCNPPADEIDAVVYNLESQVIPTKNFTAIPLHYLKQINLEDNRTYIEVLFGSDSSEHLRIKDEEKRKEIFEYFKTNIPNAKFYTDNYSKIQAGKKPLIAMGVVTAIFLWTFYIAAGIENGNEYGVSGDRKNSVAGIVLALASLGTKNVSLIFGALFIIAAISFIQKVRNPKTIFRIQVRG